VLAPGADADLTILDLDPVMATPDELRVANIIGTWVGGAEVSIPVDTRAWQV